MSANSGRDSSPSRPELERQAFSHMKLSQVLFCGFPRWNAAPYARLTLRKYMVLRVCASAGLAFFLSSCGGKNTKSYVESPGNPEFTKTKVLEIGAAVLQRKPPIDAINTYLDGFHFY